MPASLTSVPLLPPGEQLAGVTKHFIVLLLLFFPPSFSLCLHDHILLCRLYTARLCSYSGALFFCAHNHPPNYSPSNYSELLRIP